MKTFSPSSIAMFVLKSAGGINVNVAAYAVTARRSNIADYGKERILSHAEIIYLYLAQKGPMNQADINLIIKEPGFGAIKAIQEKKVYLINEKIVSRPTLRLLDGIRAIRKILYPELYKN